MKAVAILVAIMLPITVLITVIKVPQGSYTHTTKYNSLWNFVYSLKDNKPALLLLATYMFTGIADGVFSTTIFLYTDSYLQEGDKFPYLLLGMSIGGLVILPFWLSVIKRIGKHQTWMIGCVGVVCVAPFMMFATPGPWGFTIFASVAALILIFLSAGISAPAVLSDVVDYDTVRSGECRSGQFFALQALIFKFNYAIGGAAAFFLLSHFGFDAAATTHDATASLGIRLTIGVVPAVLFLLGTIPLFFFPLDKERHAEIRQQLREMESDESSGLAQEQS